jgi:Ca2+-binding RTX toxin-like protein
MAQFIGMSGGAVNFDAMSIADLAVGTASWDSPTRLRIATDADDFRLFDGSFLNYSGGRFVSGGLHRITAYRAGVAHFIIDEFAMPAATFQSYVDAGNTAGFLADVFDGDDVLSGGKFNDLLDGFAGKDRLNGGDGNDTLRGGAGNDTLTGQGGLDRLIGGGGDDLYYIDDSGDIADETGGSGSDYVISSAAAYTLGTGIERLTFYLETGPVQGGGNELANDIVAGNYNDKLFGNGGNDTLRSGDGDDTLDGGVQNDLVFGQIGNDSLIGGTGNDTLDGGTGADKLAGGLGDDTYRVDLATDGVIEAAGAGLDIVVSAASYVLPGNVENLTLLTVTTPSHWNATGNGLNNVLTGNSGNNVLDGLFGADTMGGLGGNDTYIVDNSGDSILEGHFDAKAGVFVDHGGHDTVKSSVSFNLTSDGIKIAGEIEELVLTGTAAIAGTGNVLANRITGNGAANTLSGLAGSDTLDGGAGADKMIGGIGNDTYVVDNALDMIVEDGVDKYDAVRATINVDLDIAGGGQVEDVYLLGTAALNAAGNGAGNYMVGNNAGNKLTGNGGNDSLFGFDGNDTLDGGAGGDVLLGGNGNDHYYVGGGDTVVELGATGADTVFASASFDLTANGKGDVEDLTLLMGAGAIDGTGNGLRNAITGNESDNLLLGLDGNDTLNGSNGNDTVIGGLGDDSLAGFFGDDLHDGGHGRNTINLGMSAGNDTVSHSASVDAYDIILQFDGDAADGQDVLDLDGLFDALGVATAARAARVFLTDLGASVDVRIDLNGDGAAEYLAATINSASAITLGADVLVGTG